jgi:WD40 repeat protein
MRDLAPTHQFEGHTREIFSLVRIPGSDMIVSGGMDNSIIFWKQNGQYVLRRKKLPNAVYILFANREYVGAVCYDLIYIFDLQGCVISQIGFGKRIMAASFIPSQNLISVGLIDGEFSVVDFNGEPYFFDTLHDSALVSISWVNNPVLIEEYGNIFSTLGFDRKIHVFSFVYEETSKRTAINKIETVDLKQFGIASVPKKIEFSDQANSLILLTFKSELLQFDFAINNRSIFPNLIPVDYYSPNREEIDPRNTLVAGISDVHWCSETSLLLLFENGSVDFLPNLNAMPVNLVNINRLPSCFIVDSQRKQMVIGTLSASLIFIDILDPIENIGINPPNLIISAVSGNPSPIKLIKFFLNGRIFVSLDSKMRYVIWRTDLIQSRLNQIEQFQSLILIEPDPSRKFGFIQSNGFSVCIFDFESGDLWNFQAEYRNKLVAWNRTSSLLLLTDHSGNCQILKFNKNLPDGLKILSLFDFRLEHREYSILAAKWSKNSDIIILFDSKGYLHVYSVQSLSDTPEQYTLTRIHHQKALDGIFEFVDFDPDTGYFFLSNKMTLIIYHFSRNDAISFHFDHPISALKILESEEVGVLGFEDGTIRIVDYKGKLLFSMRDHDTAITAIDFYDKEHKFISADESGKICLWNLEDIHLQKYNQVLQQYFQL